MRLVFCQYFKEMLEGLDHPLFPNQIGNKIYNHISKKAWKVWLTEQTKLINENNLNMTKKEDYEKVEKNMINFLFHHNVNYKNTL